MRKWLSPLVGALILGAMVYAASLASDWRTVLAASPAIVGTAAIVAAFVAGMILFNAPERAVLAHAAPSFGVPRSASRTRPARGRSPARVTYNERKIRSVLAGIPEVPEKHSRKRGRPHELAQILEQNCTGCGICIPFCPVDCIESVAAEDFPERTLPPVAIRYDECIGCGICAQVCTTLAWDAAVMRPVEAIEREEGIVIHDTYPPGRNGLLPGF